VTTQADVSSQIIQMLQVTIPDLDTSVGSVTRKMIDAVSSQIADASVDTQLLTYQFDVYSYTGASLDAFVQLFGMSRIPAARAVGTVTFTRQSATDTVSVPVSTQVATSSGTIVTVQTLTAAVLSPGALTVAVPVQAVIAGPAGNVAAGTLSQLVNPVAEVTSVANLSPLSGGTAMETDSQLQARFTATVFKSMSGTDAMFLGIALNNPSCTAANVVGSSSEWDEQLQVVNGAATSTITDAQYVYPSGQTAGNDIEGGSVAVPGLQYTWDYVTVPPSVTVLDSSYFPNGDIFELQYQYLDVWSRNNPSESIYNRVDVWCAGSLPVPAAQTVPWIAPPSFSSAPSNQYYVGNFVRPDGTRPTAANYLVPLAFVPILTMDPVITVGGTQYGLASAAHPLGSVSGNVSYAYQIVHQTGAFGWGPYSLAGLEWYAGMGLANRAVITIGEDYTYNAVPLQVQQAIDNWRLAAVDVLAHQALTVPLQFSLAVIFDPSVTQSVTVTAIQTVLSTWLSALGFSATIYPSSVIQQVESTTGVIAARFLIGSDAAGWNPSNPNASNVAIQALSPVGAVTATYADTNGNPTDIVLGAAQLPSFGNLVYVAKAGNSFGAFV
jgi:uncharacterized phage protein gp47/JayE